MEDAKPAGEKPAETGADAAQNNNAAADGGAGDQQPSDKKPDEGGQKPAEGQQDPNKPQDDDEPPVRKTKLDYILERKQKQLEKAKSKEIAKIDQEIKNAAGNEDDSEDEDDVDSDDEKLVEKVINKKYGHVFEEMNDERTKAAAEKEEAELQTFLTEKPQFKPYETKIRKYAQHESRKHLPLASIAYEVAGPDLERLGAEKERKAAAEAAASTTGGGSTRTDGSGFKPIAEMTKQEFADFTEKVRSGEIQWPGKS